MTPYERIGGAPAVAALTTAFYDLVDRDPLYAELHALHGADTIAVRAAFVPWLTAWLGGPPLAAQTWQGCIMSRHRAMAFGPAPAEQWIAAMARAIADVVTDAELATAMRAAMTRMAHAMVSPPA